MSEPESEYQDPPFRAFIKRALAAAGFEMHRLPPPGFYKPHRDAFADLKRLAGAETRTIFDVGANHGVLTEQFADQFPAATVYAFEPTPVVFGRLSERFKSRAQIRPFQLALSSEDGTARFSCNAFDQTNSLLPVSAQSGKHVDAGKTETVESIEIRTVSLDAFCKEKGIPRIDILKMDIQGAELMALNGARELIRTGSIDLIFCEVLFAPLYENQAWFHDISEFMVQNGYALVGFYDFGYSRSGTLAWADAIFAAPAIAAQAAGRFQA